jgi:hypothetical protein
MSFPPVLDSILREFLGHKNEAELVKGSQELVCCNFLWQERMKLIIGQTNLCDSVMKKALHHILKRLGPNPMNLEKV